MKKALITGITGQDGSYLAEFLLGKGYTVVGMVYSDKLGLENIKDIKDKLILERGNLADFESLKTLIVKHKPDEIYNLGGITFVPASWGKPVSTFDVNALGPVRIMTIIRDFLPNSRFYQASTAKIFGDPAENPQSEKTTIAPKDPYAVSKAAAHFSVQNFRSHFNLFTVSGILYNHESERRGEDFVTRKISLGAVKIKLGMAEKLALGNLEAKQDWGYAPDYVEAMWQMLQGEKPDDFIIATGVLHSVKDVCQIVFEELSLDWKKYIVRDKRFYRKENPQALYGDAGKAKKILGWRPKTSFKEMMQKMVRYDYDFIKNHNKLNSNSNYSKN